MPMFAFPAFIVVSNDALALASIKQRIFQSMQPLRRYFQQNPDFLLGSAAIVIIFLVVKNQPRVSHMVLNTI
jgi:hypothetical protein